MSLQGRISCLENELRDLLKAVAWDKQARHKLHMITRRATAMLESPPETIWKLLLQPHLNASIRTAIEMGLFDAINKSPSPKTATELAEITGGDKLLIVRLLRPLTAIHIIIEKGYETYVAGPVCKALAIPAVSGSFKFMHDEGALCCTKMHDFLAQTKYKNPEGPMGVFQYAEDTRLPLYPWLTQYPAKLTSYLTMLEAWCVDRTKWFEILPTEKMLFEGAKTNSENSVLLVDVAGGHGHDIQNFKYRFPNQRGHLVLQDLPSVIKDIKDLDPNIVRMGYDFFTEQPIKGARAYYFRSICHEWSDNKCRELLSNTVVAMKPGYSKILINEWVVPDTGCALMPALLDIQMLAVLSGMERTQTQWRQLLESVGLEIVNFHSLSKGMEDLIEAVRKV